MPGPSSTHSNTAPVLEAVVFPPVPNLGIGTLTQDDDVIMENAATVPQASPVNAAATVLEASSAYDTAPVPMASSVNTTATVPQASSVTAAATVPQASSANAGAMVPLASLATASTSMDVNAPHASACDVTEAEEQITAEIYE